MAFKRVCFAWLSGEFEAFSGSLFRDDEEWTTFSVSASEGDCDNLDITIKNPRRGLLNGAIWACLSYGTSSGDAVEIFRGRLTGIPASIIGETVDLLLIAKPSSYDSQLATLAAELRALPPYDCIWIDPTSRADPMAVLECQSALYFVDRVTHALSISDIIQGEDGVVDVTADDILYDSLDCGSAGDPPVTAVTMIGHVNWTQSASAGIGFDVPNANGSKVTLSGGSLVQSWPKTGDTIGGGYVVTKGFCNDLLGLSFKQPIQKNWSFENRAKTHTVGDVMSSSLSYTIFPANGHSFISNIKTQTGLIPAASTIAYSEVDSSAAVGQYTSYDPYASIDGAADEAMIPMHVSYNVIFIPNWSIEYGLSLSIDSSVNAQAVETIQFTIAADLQPVVILPDPTIVQQTIELSTQDLTTDADAGLPAGGGDTPPLDSSVDAFASTDRGATAIGYLVAVGRATIRKASRATTCTGTVPFEKALAFTLRKNARVSDVRLPAGQVEGKITAYTFGFDGSVATGTFEILPAVGLVADPNIVAGSAGNNSYVTGYVDSYTATSGAQLLIPGVGAAGDIGYTIDPYAAGGISTLTAAECVVAAEWQTGSVTVQVGSDDLAGGGTRTTFTDAVTDKFHLELVPTSSLSLAADVPVTTTLLNIPKQIDLSAAPI